METPSCKKCNQLVHDENDNPSHRCILKGYIKDVGKDWCQFFDSYWISVTKEKEKIND